MLRSDDEDEAFAHDDLDGVADAREGAERRRTGARGGAGARASERESESESERSGDREGEETDEGVDDVRRRAGGVGRARVRGGRGLDGRDGARGWRAKVATTLEDEDDDGDDEDGDAWGIGGDLAVDGLGKIREKRREIGDLAVWSVASAKPGNGVELLRDDDLGTFWQSDGAQPHVVNVQFQHKVELCEVALWCEYKMDESYTPSVVSIRAGASCHDLYEVQCVELENPNGWVRVRLRGADDASYLRAYFVQIAILANHQNGRDTHVRQIKIFAPRRDQARALGRSLQLDWRTAAYSQYAGVR